MYFPQVSSAFSKANYSWSINIVSISVFYYRFFYTIREIHKILQDCYLKYSYFSCIITSIFNHLTLSLCNWEKQWTIFVSLTTDAFVKSMRWSGQVFHYCCFFLIQKWVKRFLVIGEHVFFFFKKYKIEILCEAYFWRFEL